MPSTVSRPGPGLALTLAVLALTGAYFFWGQNVAGHVGGSISVPKIFWLVYALSAFFVVPAFFWRDTRLDPALRFIFGCQFWNWILRGLGELWLMYGVHAWRPPYGIYHGMFTLLMLATLRQQKRQVLATVTRPVDLNAKRFLLFSMGSSMCEIYFAYMFDKLVNYNTATTWFASSAATFAQINRITAVVDVFAYAGLALTAYRYYRPADPVAVTAKP